MAGKPYWIIFAATASFRLCHGSHSGAAYCIVKYSRAILGLARLLDSHRQEPVAAGEWLAVRGFVFAAPFHSRSSDALSL
jgi:hypothetical protein